MAEPTPEFQVKFLEYIQRLLDGGGFAATYKFALLMALADLSVEKGSGDGGALPLHARDVARKFIVYYSRQSRPYVRAGARTGGVLHQNTGKQASVVNQVSERAQSYAVSGVQSMTRQLVTDSKLVGRVSATVAQMPLWKLQTIGTGVDDFLYADRGKGRDFVLRPGIAFCFRKFHGFVYRMAQDSWVRFVRCRQQNQKVLGETADLAEFMFGTDRASLRPYREILADLQHGQCFYCGRGAKVDHVDHFVPWSWYSLDWGHNFVLACGPCNAAKSDVLAAREHLAHWLERNEVHGLELGRQFDERKLPHDLEGSIFVARWAYDRVDKQDGRTWVRGRDFEPYVKVPF